MTNPSVEIAFLPLIKEVDGRPCQLLRVCAEAPSGAFLSAEITTGDLTEKIVLPLYSSEENRAVYRAFFPVPDPCRETEAAVRVLFPDGSDCLKSCICGMTQWKEICFVPTTHHDLGYTHTIDDLLKEYCDYYDRVLNFCDKTADYPPEAQYRYTVEQFWSLDYYLSRTSEENVERLKRYIREGRIELTATYANVIDSNLNSEEIVRLILPAMEFAEECGVKIKSAAQVDMPGLSSATVRALCDAGIPYFFAGFPQYFGWSKMGMAASDGHMPDMKRSHWDESAICPWGHPFTCRWKADAADPRSLFTWYQFGYGWFCNDSKFSDTNDSFEEIDGKLPEFLHELTERGYPYPLMRYIDKGTDNVRPEIGICDIVRQWNETYLYPKMCVSTNLMFFEKLEAAVPEPLLICGEMPHTDYTMLSLSEAEHNTMNARSRHLLTDTDRMLGSAVLHGFAPHDSRFSERVKSAWRDILLFDEHCFGMSHVHGARFRHNRGLKMQYALRAAMKADSLHSDADEAIARNLVSDPDVVTVFNPAGCETPCVIHAFGDVLSSGNLLQDMKTGRCFPVQTATADECMLPYPDYDDQYYLSRITKNLTESIAVTDPVPPCSFRSFRVLKADTAENTALPTVSGDVHLMESPFFALKISAADGRVLSLKDKEADRELLDPDCRAGFGRLIIRDLSAADEEIPQPLSVSRRLYGETADSVLIRSASRHLPSVVTEIILYKTIKRIDVNVRLSLAPHPASMIYMEFPFAASAPGFFFATPNGCVDLSDPDSIVPGANVNQVAFSGWCGVQDSGYRTVMASPEANIVSFGDIHPTAVSHAHHFLTEDGFEDPYVDLSSVRSGHLYAMLTYSNAKTNFSAFQSGQAIYRFSFTGGSDADASAFAAQVLGTPVVFPGRSLSADAPAGFCLNGAPVQLRHIGVSGRGCTLSFRNPLSGPAEATLRLPGTFACCRTDLAGAAIGPAGLQSELRLNLPPFATAYYRLEPAEHPSV